MVGSFVIGPFFVSIKDPMCLFCGVQLPQLLTPQTRALDSGSPWRIQGL